MCESCWDGYSKDSLEWHDDIPLAQQLVDLLYSEPEGGAGGPLHVFLDDWNIDTDPKPWQLAIFPPSVRGITLAIVEVMTPMSPRQRAEVLRASLCLSPGPD